jgi:taurine transport system substrate-binding protein
MNKIFASILVAASVLATAVATVVAADPQKITVAYFREWPTANQVAQADKWYDEELGVEVEWRAFDTGVEMADAMVAGEVDISFSMGVVPFALAVTAGAPIKVVGVAVDTGGADNCVKWVST